MSKVSIIIPTRVESYELSPGVTVLQKTVQDIYEKATGDFEVIVAFDGPPYQTLPPYDGLTSMYLDWEGTKPTLNKAVNIAKGKYIFKVDAHCMFDYGFDEKLQEYMEDNWVVTPRFYVLNAEEWKWQDHRFYDHFMLPFPFWDRRGVLFKAGGHWKQRTEQRVSISPMDENMKLHGSSFFMTKEYFTERLGGLSSFGSGTWNGEDIEITMKTWLGPWDGKLMVNKNTWYAHMHRGGQRPREWHVSYSEAVRSAVWTAQYWLSNSWEDRTKDVEWLIEKFVPIPGWPETWKEILDKWRIELNLQQRSM